MVQRSPTYVVSIEPELASWSRAVLPVRTAPDVADLLAPRSPSTRPTDAPGTTAAMAEHDRRCSRGCARSASRPSSAINGTGAFQLKFLRRGGGYYINVGCSELIADGKVAIRSGSGVRRFVPSGIELEDGEVLDADVVVFATGYQGMLQTARRLLGDEVADRCGPVWGLDGEGELQGVWRQSGHEGLWFMGGNLAMARFYGKFLALQIKAMEEGLLEPRTLSEGRTA